MNIERRWEKGLDLVGYGGLWQECIFVLSFKDSVFFSFPDLEQLLFAF